MQRCRPSWLLHGVLDVGSSTGQGPRRAHHFGFDHIDRGRALVTGMTHRRVTRMAHSRLPALSENHSAFPATHQQSAAATQIPSSVIT
ncbi:hypothetical protein AQJ91_42650 [Streptomyces dysideae]|uniref:Uncharacterized protein n=1 Tax=Streptomyces dysideae TaxID=909626 RepID=A0A101UR26_9ACTN|nr:hypothetical protein AQJ91_42650 [Streptomyces dysideae]